MLTLYYYPGACSLAPHIILEEGEFEFELKLVDLHEKKTELGQDFFEINSKGCVPVLAWEDGTVLTEVVAILQYLGDQVSEKSLMPKAGTIEQYRLQETLSYLSSEIHKLFGVFYDPGISDKYKDETKKKILSRLNYLSGQLGERDYLMGNQFTVADAYFFTLLGFTTHFGIELASDSPLLAYMGRVLSRHSVVNALKKEGLIE